MIKTISYREALAIAVSLKDSTSKAATLLREKAAERNHSLTRIIMQYGDPANWKGLPKTKTRGRPKGGTNHSDGISITLEHIDTTATITAPSAREFCQKAFGHTMSGDLLRLSYVRRRIMPHIKGWYHPDTLRQTIKVQDIYGNETTATLRQWVKDYGETAASFFALLEGKKRFTGSGLARADTKIKSSLTPRQYRISGLTLRKGDQEIKAGSIKALSNILHCDIGQLYPLLYGFRDHVKGYQLTSVDIERKAVLQPLAG